MHHIVKRGSTLPTKKIECFTTVSDDQDRATIKIFRGERPLASDNIFMGELPPIPMYRGNSGEAKVCFLNPAFPIQKFDTITQIEVRVELDPTEEIVVVSSFP